MSGSSASRLTWFFAAAGLLFVPHLPTASADPEEGGGGRFLYAGDDDWDWASPLGAPEPSKLSKYGAMPWSALDWAEDGLEEVRGVLIGSPPSVGDYLTMESLGVLRGQGKSYKHEPLEGDVIADLLGSDAPPNVIILMNDTAKGRAPNGEEIEKLVEFVKGGGRLVALDDWQRYPPLLEELVAEALVSPNAEPGAEPPEEVEPEAKEPDPKFVRRVTALVKDLGDGHFRVREAAMVELRELGLPAIELADELRPDDPEIAARLTRLRADLAPAPSPLEKAVENERRRAKHVASAERIGAAAAKLELARVPHEIESVFVDKEGAPLPALRIAFPVP